MLIYIADDEPLLLEDLNDAVRAAEPSAEICAFDWAKPLIDDMKANNAKPDIAFLDIEMPGMSGMELAKEIRQFSPYTRIVFVTGFTEYAVEAFSIHADGYIMKPVTAEKIHTELKHLRPYLKMKPPKRLMAKCFGNFEIYIDGEPMHFNYSKTRELMAYLINRNGALCSNGELMAVLWEDESGDERKKDYFKKLRNDLKNQLDNKGLGDILLQQRGMLGLVSDEIECDYFDWLNGKPEVENAYHGEYMSQYSWAEMTVGLLDH